MTELNGFVMLHRSIREWEWYTDMNTKAVFIELMLTANFKAKQYRGYDIPRGASVTSTDSLANSLGLTRQNVRTALKHLEKTGEITIAANPFFSIITLNNWDKYQQPNQRLTNGQPTSNQRLTNDQPTSNQRLTNDQPTSNQRLTNDQPTSNQRLTNDQPTPNQRLTNDQPHLNNDNKDNNENNEYNDNKEGEAACAAGAPTLSQVRDYFWEMHYESDPKMFYDYYSATGWMRGKTPITDWRSLADVWEKRGDRAPSYYDRSTHDRQSRDRQDHSDYSGGAPRSWENSSSIYGDLSQLTMFND